MRSALRSASITATPGAPSTSATGTLNSSTRFCEGWISGARAGSGKACPRATTRWVGTGFPKRSCSNKKIERDDDSKKSHIALAAAGPQEVPLVLCLPESAHVGFRRWLRAQDCIEAERPCAGRRQIEASEAEHDGERATIEHREKVLRKVLDEIGARHLARQDEGDGPGQQTQHQHPAKNEFEHAGGPEQRERRDRLEHRDRRELEELRHAELEQAQAGDEPEEA